MSRGVRNRIKSWSITNSCSPNSPVRFYNSFYKVGANKKSVVCKSSERQGVWQSDCSGYTRIRRSSERAGGRVDGPVRRCKANQDEKEKWQELKRQSDTYNVYSAQLSMEGGGSKLLSWKGSKQVNKPGKLEGEVQFVVSLDSRLPVAGLAWRALTALSWLSGPRLTDGLAPIRSASIYIAA